MQKYFSVVKTLLGSSMSCIIYQSAFNDSLINNGWSAIRLSGGILPYSLVDELIKVTYPEDIRVYPC